MKFKLVEDIWTRDGEYAPLRDSKYQRLQRKPINTLSLDEIKYLFAVNRAHYGMHTKQYNSIDELLQYMIDEDRENSFDLDMFEDCYNYLHGLSFPLTVYRALNSVEEESGKVFGRSWTTDFNIYKDKTSTFSKLDNLVATEIDSNVVDNSATIVNYFYYTAKRKFIDKNKIYGEYEISLKNNYKQSDLHNLRYVDKDKNFYIKRIYD